MATIAHDQDELDDSHDAPKDVPARETPQQERREKLHEEQETRTRTATPGRVVYDAILREADEELARSSSALFWSGLAAGLCMGFSYFSEGILKRYVPDASWAPAVTRLGYPVGFIIVIMARQQLFTENTLTPILPLLRHKDASTLLNVARLWGVVLIANLIGAWLVAGVAMRTSMFESEVRSAMIGLARKTFEPGFGTVLLRGIFAGWLIATLVWMMPSADSARLWIILIMTYIIGIGSFAHIIAGAVEVFSLGWIGEQSWLAVIGHFIVPALLGNIIGGVTLAAGLNHAQIVAGGDQSE